MKLTSKQYLISGLACAVLALQMGCSKAVDRPSAPAGTPPSPTSKAPSKLGDLQPFRAIAADVAQIAQGGDLVKARLRIKDLEIAWDEAEAGLKPRAASDWHTVDKAIDQALEALRRETPNANECRQRLSELLKTFDAMK